MNRQIEEIRKTRTTLLERLEDLTFEQFNQILPAFRNNINWNMGHMIVVQQQICYQQSGLPMSITANFVKSFGPGSMPEAAIGVIEIVAIKELLVTSLEQLENDYENRIFSNYTTWTSRLGNVVNIDDGLEFLSFHEKIHAEIILAIRKIVRRIG